MNQIILNESQVLSFIDKNELSKMEEEANHARNQILNRTSLGSEFLGWVDYPLTQTIDERRRIMAAAKEIRSNSDVLIVIGIGGSYLGAKAALELFKPYFTKQTPEIIFVGNTLSGQYTKELLSYVKDKDFSINVISKSGKTLEPAIAFRLFRSLLEEKYGKEAHKRIYATTDPSQGVLRKMANDAGWTTFSVPPSIGGRYSVLTAVGLLPIATAGYDIEAIIQGAKDAMNQFHQAPYQDNVALRYAALRNILYHHNKTNEFLVAYEPNMLYFLEWLKQLFGESEGKDHRGLFPVSIINTTDLHSLGQYIQDGQRFLFETVFHIRASKQDINVPKASNNADELDLLVGKSLHTINENALKGTMMAHVEGGVPNLLFEVNAIHEYEFGFLTYFFMFATGISGCLLGVNPFDQPGVELYKKKMMELLRK